MTSVLRLKPREDRRLRRGHLWVFSNEIDVEATPLTALEPGELVEVRDAADRTLGYGYAHPHALLSVRLLSRGRRRPDIPQLLRRRLTQALALRERLYGTPFYRLVHGEGDLLPGLIVDRYGDVLVAQLTTAGMERLRDEVLAALVEVMRPQGILLRHDTPMRALEGLPTLVDVGYGHVPDEVELEEEGVRFRVPLRTGQKTGWFFDQRPNRLRARAYAEGARVLDVFAYLGGWSLGMLQAGAREAVAVDSSGPALATLRANAEFNGMADRVRTVEADAFDALTRWRAAGERFDVVVLDPPAFVKRKKDLAAGLRAYERLVALGLGLLGPGGVLVASSCSGHVDRAMWDTVIRRAARRAHRTVQLLDEGSQGPDHPVHPLIPETRYLKVTFARVVEP